MRPSRDGAQHGDAASREELEQAQGLHQHGRSDRRHAPAHLWPDGRRYKSAHPACAARSDAHVPRQQVCARQGRAGEQQASDATGKRVCHATAARAQQLGGEERQIKLLVATFQNLFPPIQVQSMKLSQARRIVLLNYNAATGTIDWRHYLISVRPVGVSKSVRRVVEGSRSASRTGTKRGRLPDLSSTQDISDYVLGRTNGSGSVNGEFETDASEAESEAEDIADPRKQGPSARPLRRTRQCGQHAEGGASARDWPAHGAQAGQDRRGMQRRRGALPRVHQEVGAGADAAAPRPRREEEAAGAASTRAGAERLASESEAEDEAADDEADESDDEDEFAYEDQFGDAEAMDKDEELFDDDQESHSDGEQGEAEEEESDDDDGGVAWNPKRSESGYDNPPGIEPHSDESDLEPIPVGGMQHDYGSADEWPEYSDEEEEEQAPKPKKSAPSKRPNDHLPARRAAAKLSLCRTLGCVMHCHNLVFTTSFESCRDVCAFRISMAIMPGLSWLL
ncbi:hypothetical protein L1887_57910 [Cichorium endivia]|nr:hypothetical protein L1887_57910 [Cichorium endivia]